MPIFFQLICVIRILLLHIKHKLPRLVIARTFNSTLLYQDCTHYRAKIIIGGRGRTQKSSSQASHVKQSATILNTCLHQKINI